MFSENSDMSIVSSSFSLLNKWLANVFAISVFPTPVGPKIKMIQLASLGLFIPVRDLFITEAMAFIALYLVQ